MKIPNRERILDTALVMLGLGLAVAIRVSLWDFRSIDYFNYTKTWYNALKTGGFFAFAGDFSNYNLPYLYLLYLIARFLPDVPGLIATKLPSIAADFIIAWFAFRIVSFKDGPGWLSLVAAFACLFAPTVVLNSAFWGQADALYTAALVGCLFYLMRRQGLPAMILYGIALAFKAQAILLSPFLLSVFLRGEIRWRYCLAVPIVMLLALVPAMIAGRPLLDLLLIYPAQAGQYEQLSMHAPSALQWVPSSGQFYGYFYPVGLLLSGTAALVFAFGVARSEAKLRPALMMELALYSVMLAPFLLPKMHERYFFPADVLSIIVAFYLPQYSFVAISMITISFFAYQPTLFGVEPVPIGLLSVGVFILLVVLGKHIFEQLYPGTAARAPETTAVQ
jgi:Gpi18-like mannosyltransferase